MALDFPDHVKGFVSLTVIPTIDAWQSVNMGFAMNAFHWFMLAQPYDQPERLLEADPDAFIDAALAKMAGSLDRFEPEVLSQYRIAFRKPSVRHAICEDYRAAAQEDLEHDKIDRKAHSQIDCPVMILWSKSKTEPANTPLEIWKKWAKNVTGAAIEGGHHLPEFSAPEVIRNIAPFLADLS